MQTGDSGPSDVLRWVRGESASTAVCPRTGAPSYGWMSRRAVGGPLVRGARGQPSSSARSRRERSRTGRADITYVGQQPRGCRGSDAVQV